MCKYNVLLTDFVLNLPKQDKFKTSTCRKRKCSSTDLIVAKNLKKDICPNFVPTLQGLIEDASKEKSLQAVAPVLKDVLEKVLSVGQIETVQMSDSDKTLTEETVLKNEDNLQISEEATCSNNNTSDNVDVSIAKSTEKFKSNLDEEDALITMILNECQESGIDLAELCKDGEKMKYFDSMLSRIKYLNDSMKCALKEYKGDVGAELRFLESLETDEEKVDVEPHNVSEKSENVEYPDDFSATVTSSRDISSTNISTDALVTFKPNDSSNRSESGKSTGTVNSDCEQRQRRDQLCKEYFALIKRNKQLRRCNYVLHDLMANRLVDENISNNVAELRLCSKENQAEDEYTQKLLEYGRLRKEMESRNEEHLKIVQKLKMARAERMAVLQKEFYCLLIREKEVASGLQGKRSKIPIHEKVIEKYLRLQQQRMSELGAARLLFIRQKNRINCLLNEKKIRNKNMQGNITVDSSDCEDFYPRNCNCYSTSDRASGVELTGEDLSYFQTVIPLDDKQIKEQLQSTIKTIAKKDKELQELFTDSEDIKERLEALKCEKESIQKEKERLHKKSNLSKSFKPGMVSEFTTFVDKTKELTEMLQALKEGYARDQAKLENMRREISYMAHLKRKNEKPLAIVPDNPTLQYQGRLSRTGLCPALRRNPITNNNKSNSVVGKKPVFKIALSGQALSNSSGKCDSARNCSGANSVIQMQTVSKHEKILMRSTSLNRHIDHSNSNWKNSTKCENKSGTSKAIKSKEPLKNY